MIQGSGRARPGRSTGLFLVPAASGRAGPIPSSWDLEELVGLGKDRGEMWRATPEATTCGCSPLSWPPYTWPWKAAGEGLCTRVKICMFRMMKSRKSACIFTKKEVVDD